MSDNGKKLVYFKGLGCPKNEVDGDVILGYLKQRGIETTDSVDQADYLLVNTCAFIQSAKEESIEEILKLAAVKNTNGKKQRLLVSGCLSQRYPNELLNEMPEIDGMIGIDEYDKIGALLDTDSAYITRPPSMYKEAHAVQVLRDRPFAYLKIADGCDCRCSYCAIPMMRGDFRSRKIDAISSDVDRLLAHGVVELDLIAQDVAYYGFDIGKGPLALLEMLESKPGNFWVRPFYLHPKHMTNDILDFFAASKKFCQYLESPIQHISNTQLKEMNRGYDRDQVYDMIERMRAKLPNAVWRTTFIVGFPGESEKDFDELCSFVADQKIHRAGVFGYSHEEGTASFRYKTVHTQAKIKARQEELMRIINENADDFNSTLVGKQLPMIVEEFDSENLSVTGRLYCDAPEIDFSIRVPCGKPQPLGFHQVRVVDTGPEGFVGEFVPIANNGG
ncbi:MAG: 30S ribosomal protein S12 methylthiotransferase RimO [Candidatus Zixiibacteriota bacterium]